MDKDCTLIFANKQEPYPFSSKDIGLALKTAKERRWDVLAIKTPDWVLSVFDHETYNKMVSEVQIENAVV